jgi:hypothetical protein
MNPHPSFFLKGKREVNESYFSVTPAKAGVQKNLKKTGFLLPQE